MGSSLRRMIIISSAITGGSLILFLVFFWGLRTSMNDAVQSITRANMTIAEQSQAVEALAQLKHDAPLAEQYQAKFSALLPKKEELLGVTRAIDTTARTRNVTFQFNFDGGETPASIGIAGNIPFALTAEGSYDDLVGFFNDLESKSARFIMEFEGLNFEITGAGYRAGARGRTFFRGS